MDAVVVSTLERDTVPPILPEADKVGSKPELDALELTTPDETV